MKVISRYWASIITTVFIALLLMLAVRQLRWIDDMSERERTRLARDLSETAGQLAESIRDEFLVLPAVFRMDAEEIEKALATSDWIDFRHRWDTWKVYATDPSIVAGFHLLDLAAEDPLGRVSTWNGAKFVREKSKDLASSLRGKIFMREREYGVGTPPPVVSDDLLVPLDPRHMLWFIVRIDQKAVIHRLIPRLAQQYLRANTDYYFRILDIRSGEIVYRSEGITDARIFAQPDIRYPLLAARNPLPLFDGTDQAFGAGPAADLGGGHPSDLPADSPLWLLEAVHRSGSLAAVVRIESLRSVALSMGIIGLLAAAFAILALAVRRQQDLTDRQNEFIASITHELKTPIAVIRAAADNLADGVVRDPGRTVVYGGTIKRESGRLANMIDRLLSYSRLGDGSKYRFETLDLRPLATRVVNGYRAELEDARFEVDLSFSESPILVCGDTIALEFALGNLISNALKHARVGLYLGIDIRVEHDTRKGSPKGCCAVISVSDKGPGISRKERRLIFETFYRGASAQKDQIPGSGIGLGLIRRVVEAHGGSIRLEGGVERGTTFVIRLPLEVRDGG